MNPKMQAAFVEQFGQPLAIREVDIPEPGPSQTLVKTEACGVCHTGLHAAEGDWSLKPGLRVAHISAERDAAPLMCAGITSYKGIKETQAKPGEWMVILGVGGLGHLGVEYAKAMGLHVRAVDIDDVKLAHAKKLGSDALINAKLGGPVAEVIRATGGGAHGVPITAPSLPACKQGVAITRKWGTCVLVGIPPGEFPTPLFEVVANCITIRGSFNGSRRDMAEALALAADGKVKADIKLQPLSAINSVLQRLKTGNVPSRVVLELAGN